MIFEPDPETPGLMYAVDETTGIRRPFYDPSGTMAPPAPPVPEAPPPVTAPPVVPPPVSDQAATDWSAAQEPASVIPRATGAPPPPPEAPGGTVLQKAKVSPGQPGYTYDKAAEEQRGEDLLDRTLEVDRRRAAEDLIRNEQQLEMERQKNEAARQEAINSERSSRFERELDSVVRKEINPDRIQQNQSVAGSILGIVGQVLGALSLPGSGVQRWQEQVQLNLDRRIQRDIDAQKEEKESMINMLTKKLGSAQQAENHYRAQVNAYTADVLENRLRRLGRDMEYSDQIQGLRDQAMAYNEAAKAASFGKPGTAEYTFERPKPVAGAGGPKYTNETLSTLKGLGIDEKRYRDGLTAKTASGLTVSQTGDTIKQLDADVNMLNSLAAANGGTIPQKGVINIPDFLVGTMAQMGIKSGMSAEQVNQMMQQHLIGRAKQLGGETTAGDLAAVQTEIGTSAGAYMRWLQRQRDVHNRTLRSTLEQEFPGRGQQVFDIMLGGSSKNVGVPQAKPQPFETENAPEAKTERPPPSDVEQRQKANRDRVRKGISDFFSGSEAPFRAPGAGPYRGFQ